MHHLAEGDAGLSPAKRKVTRGQPLPKLTSLKEQREKTLDLFFLSLSHTRAEAAEKWCCTPLYNVLSSYVILFWLTCVCGTLVKMKNRRMSSSVECYNSPSPCGMCKEVTKSLTDSCTFAHLLSLPVLSIHRLLFFLSVWCCIFQILVPQAKISLIYSSRDIFKKKFSKPQRLQVFFLFFLFW